MNKKKTYPYYYNRQHLLSPQEAHCLRKEDILSIPDSVKTKKVFPIGDEFFIPEFKISKCNTTRLPNQYARGFTISMNKIKKEFKNAESSVKAKTEKLITELNKLVSSNNEEIKKLEEELLQKRKYLYNYLDCPPQGLETDPLCLTPEAKKTIREILELEDKLRDLKSKRNYWGTLNSSRNKFQDSLKELEKNAIPNVNWPKSWPTIEDIKYMPILVDEYLNLPKTLKDMNIDSSLIKSIPLPEKIENTLNIPSNLNLDIDINTLKSQIQFDNVSSSANQVLTDIKNKAISNLEKYNMCLFIKNSPYSLEIQLQYISSFKKLVESYIYGCLEKAKNAALLTFSGYIPSIISSYGATIPPAISNTFASYWSTLKKCLFDVYNAFKKDIEKIIDTSGFENFLKAIEKYVSIDFVLERRTVSWENKGSLVDLALGNRQKRLDNYMSLNRNLLNKNIRKLPITISIEEEYVQSDPQFSYMVKDYNLDEESLRKIIYKCGRLGMWLFITLKEHSSPEGTSGFWLNVRRFYNNILSGYTINRNPNGQKIRKDIDIPIKNIANLQCYDPSTDSQDNIKDLFTKAYFTDFCSSNKGQFFGKGYIDIGKGVLIYYEVYECGIYTGIYVDEVFKSELYIPRFSKEIKHVFKYPLSPTSSYTISIDIDKKEDEIQKRLRIWLFENVLDDNVNLIFWKIKLPW